MRLLCWRNNTLTCVIELTLFSIYYSEVGLTHSLGSHIWSIANYWGHISLAIAMMNVERVWVPIRSECRSCDLSVTIVNPSLCSSTYRIISTCIRGQCWMLLDWCLLLQSRCTGRAFQCILNRMRMFTSRRSPFPHWEFRHLAHVLPKIMLGLATSAFHLIIIIILLGLHKVVLF